MSSSRLIRCEVQRCAFRFTVTNIWWRVLWQRCEARHYRVSGRYISGTTIWSWRRLVRGWVGKPPASTEIPWPMKENKTILLWVAVIGFLSHSVHAVLIQSRNNGAQRNWRFISFFSVFYFFFFGNRRCVCVCSNHVDSSLFDTLSLHPDMKLVIRSTLWRTTSLTWIGFFIVCLQVGYIQYIYI